MNQDELNEGDDILSFGDVEWDPEKERINIAKHGIDFRTASWVFDDEYRITWNDGINSNGEIRSIVLGRVNTRAIILFVVYTDRNDSYRIISARYATKKEEKMYYDRQT